MVPPQIVAVLVPPRRCPAHVIYDYGETTITRSAIHDLRMGSLKHELVGGSGWVPSTLSIILSHLNLVHDTGEHRQIRAQDHLVIFSNHSSQLSVGSPISVQ